MNSSFNARNAYGFKEEDVFIDEESDDFGPDGPICVGELRLDSLSI